MRLVLASAPQAMPGPFFRHAVAAGLEVADLPVTATGRTVDHPPLARIEPARFRSGVRNASDGDKSWTSGWRS